MRWQYCWSWASGKHQLLKAFLPLSLHNFFFRENVSVPYLYLSNFAIPSNTEWIPVLPWLGLSRCPKIGCTNVFLAFMSLYKMQIHCHKHAESLGSMAEVLPSGCLWCGGIPLPSHPIHPIPAELTVLEGWAQSPEDHKQRSPWFGWKQLWDEELMGPNLQFEAQKVKVHRCFQNLNQHKVVIGNQLSKNHYREQVLQIPLVLVGGWRAVSRENN